MLAVNNMFTVKKYFKRKDCFIAEECAYELRPNKTLNGRGSFRARGSLL